MENNAIKEFNNTVNTLETVLYALKWLQHENNDIFCYEAEIAVFDSALNRLKIFGINNVGCIDE